ncbi:hypothetical protein GCM10011501_26450 [Thalassotalea profundi]|uniref:Uncharacterized protein n=1 Tax=Thalassotalea profundi TaxID=2036687 RepID=A0ABQ3IV59_9GAMM|nr:hypothetical protein GCM10011501_26450 [Thalassotalea profundi]
MIDLLHSRLIKITIFTLLFVSLCTAVRADCLFMHEDASFEQNNHNLAQTNQQELKQENKGQKTPEKKQWVETFHNSVSNGVYQSAVWFDNFFTDQDCQQQKPSTNARIRLEWAPKARDLQEFKARFRIKVNLPHFSNKMDLVLSDDDEDSQNQLPLESMNTQPQTEKEHFAAAVRYVHIKNSQQYTDTRLGISGGDIFTRFRFVKRYTGEDNHSLKIEPSIYYFLQDGWGSKLLLEYDYQLSKKSQLRFNYSTHVSQSFSGVRWKHGVYKLNQINNTTASLLGLQVEGERNGERGFIVDKYTLSYRYRFNAYKEWLYFEVEPFVEWPEEDNYHTIPGIALRVEGFFYKN